MDDLDVQALRAQGKPVVENPNRVVIGPLSPATREAWKADAGKSYLRQKLGGPRGSGICLSQLVRDRAGTWYVLALFTSQDCASRALELMGRGYPWYVIISSSLGVLSLSWCGLFADENTFAQWRVDYVGLDLPGGGDVIARGVWTPRRGLLGGGILFNGWYLALRGGSETAP
jgi:hypothetical protein